MSAVGTIAIEVWFPHPPEAVFDAWTRPASLADWFAAGSWAVASVDFVAEAGASWRVDFHHPNGGRYSERGRVILVERPRRLCFTLAQHGLDGLPVETEVEVRFEPSNSGTRMLFRQAGLVEPGQRDANAAGWHECFQKLAAALAGQADR